MKGTEEVEGVRQFMDNGALLGHLWMEGYLGAGDPLDNQGIPTCRPGGWRLSPQSGRLQKHPSLAGHDPSHVVERAAADLSPHLQPSGRVAQHRARLLTGLKPATAEAVRY